MRFYSFPFNFIHIHILRVMSIELLVRVCTCRWFRACKTTHHEHDKTGTHSHFNRLEMHTTEFHQTSMVAGFFFAIFSHPWIYYLIGFRYVCWQIARAKKKHPPPSNLINWSFASIGSTWNVCFRMKLQFIIHYNWRIIYRKWVILCLFSLRSRCARKCIEERRI